MRRLQRCKSFVGLALFCLAASALAQDGEQAEMVRSLHAHLARSFTLGQDLPIDPGLRSAADDIAAAHMARIDKLFPAWVQEERKLQATAGKPADARNVFFAVWARLLNELALWQLEPGDAEYERATLAVLQTAPRVCQIPGDFRFHDYASRVMRLQAMPEPQRSAALASERQLLAHWGQPRATLQPWPDPLPQEQAMQQVRRLQTAGQRPALALSPLLTVELLGEQKELPALHPQVMCALQAWQLRVSVKQGASPAAALSAFRYGTLITATERLAGMFDPASGETPAVADKAPLPAFPALAGHFQVTGKTTMRVQLDGAGKATQASVANRKIDVVGIRGTRPVAFETTFDRPALDYALKTRTYDKPADSAPTLFEMVWSLPGAPARIAAGAKP
jgi:hypothetical protein